MSIVAFEDSHCALLAPITHARIACSIHCASYTLLDLLSHLGEPTHGMVRPHLQTIQKIDFPELQPMEEISAELASTTPRLLLNARIAPTRSNFASLQRLLQLSHPPTRQPGVVWDREHVAAILNPPWTYGQLSQLGFEGIGSLLEQSHAFPSVDPACNLHTFAAPHEVIACNMDSIGENLEWRLQQNSSGGSLTQTADGVFVAPNAQVGEYVLTDTRKGPILIESGAQIGPYTLLRGPIYIGPNTKILEHSAIKDAVTLSHTTKIGGEVEASVVEPYSNKQHHGFLGHSYLGSWINLGAGTCNSDLKNTYGTVNMEYPFGKATTNMQFLGCIMGDYSKTAINTGIFTGKVIGVCSMMYGFVTSNVPSFVNYARLFGQLASLPPEVMISTQQRMFARRNVQQRGCDIQLIYDMHRMTQNERDRLGDALTL